MTAPPDDTTSDTSAIIAALRTERDAALAREAALAEELAARTAELAERYTEYSERIEQQAGTTGDAEALTVEIQELRAAQAAGLEVLQAMVASPGDTQPVFDLIARQAADLCEVPIATVAMFDGTMVRLVAQSGFDAAYAEVFAKQFPRSPSPDFAMGRAIVNRRVEQIEDTGADTKRDFTPPPGPGSALAVPLLRNGAPLGVIAVGRRVSGSYSKNQITLLKTFAEQAVIAITSAETYRALQERTVALAQRNTEYGERIEHQSATIDVLKAMSASPGDPQPVFDLIVDRARDLCDAYGATVFEFDGTGIHWRAATGVSDDPAVRAAYEAQFPMVPTRGWAFGRAILDRRIIRIDDMEAEPGLDPTLRGITAKSNVTTPIMRGDEVIGAIGMGSRAKGGFSDSQVELLKTFAEQAVIAITSAETYRALQTRTSDLQEALEYQTATSDVLKVISRSTFDLQPVLDTVVETAARLCDADTGTIAIREGEVYRYVVSTYSATEPEYWAISRRRTIVPGRETVAGRVALEGKVVHVDILADPEFAWPEVVASGRRTTLGVPLLREGAVLGTVVLARKREQPFTERQIELVRTFADQAVIAIENTRLITETREALEQQTATAEVLQVINASPGNLAPVFEAMLEKAMRLCEAAFGVLATYDGECFPTVAMRGVAAGLADAIREPVRPSPGMAYDRIVRGADIVHIADITDDDVYRSGNRIRRALADQGGARTALFVALRGDDALFGVFIIYRKEVRPFSDKQIALLQNFAAQAVIAMENARLLDEVRQRQEELRVTFENMGDGVAMFGETQHLVAWNRKFQDILDVPDDIIARRQTFSEYVYYLAARGEFGPDPEEQVRQFVEQAGRSRTYQRTRPDGRVIEVRHNPVPDGGFVLIYADITERKRNEAEIRAARDAAEEASRTIETAYRDLKAAQANLIQAEKMASLGQLTAGIAHEIKNPLNFVNNFAALSVDLLSELKETAAPGFAVLPEKQRAEVEDVSAMLTSNLEKITEHGKRADNIVKAMLEHSRGSSGERRMVDLNTLIDDALNLAYHGARAQDQSFNITLERDFSAGIGPIEVNQQDITRVFLNIFSNGFYATTRRARDGKDAGFESTLKVTTRDVGEAVEIRVRDNGMGIPADIRDKLFQPFFTTKPTGEGTGLGLSITYDIVTQQHGGSIAVDSKVGEYSEFTILLPRNP